MTLDNVKRRRCRLAVDVGSERERRLQRSLAAKVCARALSAESTRATRLTLRYERAQFDAKAVVLTQQRLQRRLNCLRGGCNFKRPTQQTRRTFRKQTRQRGRIHRQANVCKKKEADVNATNECRSSLVARFARRRVSRLRGPCACTLTQSADSTSIANRISEKRCAVAASNCALDSRCLSVNSNTTLVIFLVFFWEMSWFYPFSFLIVFQRRRLLRNESRRVGLYDL